MTCLEVLDDVRPKVFTGSRDHYVKLYDVSAEGEGIYDASFEFTPRHYDSVTSIRVFNDSLFTASKDLVNFKF